MRKSNSYIILMTILPWLTIPFIGVKTIKRFLPGALFMCLYTIFEGNVAERRKWWWFFYNVKPNVLGEMPLILGPFFVGSLWILKFTFSNFKKYVILNVMIDSFFTYVLLNWFKRIGYASLIRINKLQLSLLFLVKLLLMYSFQYFYENYLTLKKSSPASK
ncbi:hypothetical protein RCG23_05840 [Neobacillus sp. PS3-34]|uniref:hypothetical protein n=1 Tax=Neobacillus sp. PS3-34 TaxID=3070678 RepID=UPI0027DF9292|nr:hypothetical protein [Neobacillus sp. PS3-34]WML49510.1 hypothetical protein RCG23_05840 [Neobacillus sp. PS3-34]